MVPQKITKIVEPPPSFIILFPQKNFFLFPLLQQSKQTNKKKKIPNSNNIDTHIAIHNPHMSHNDEKKDRRRKNVMGSYNYYKMFGCFNRKFKINDLGPPRDVIDVFNLYTKGESEMSPDTFLRFLVEFQREEGYTIGDVERVMDRVLNLSRSHLTRYVFTVNDFFQYLLLDDVNGPIKTQVVFLF
ncbi:putative phosphoinositide phospholipase C [Helianthus annuus]|nr:putative phosphoinositide phospholipase C [Helianthus annuus]